MGTHCRLGQFEHLVLLAVLRLGVEASALEIRSEIGESAGRSVSRRRRPVRVLSFGVAHRTPELGLRLAIGAQPATLRGLVLRRGCSSSSSA